MCAQKDGLERTAVYQVIYVPMHVQVASHPLPGILNLILIFYSCNTLLPTPTPLIIFATIHTSLCTVCDPPCKNGACSEDMRCVCSEGWTGEDCSTPGGSLPPCTYVRMIHHVPCNPLSFENLLLGLILHYQCSCPITHKLA